MRWQPLAWAMVGALVLGGSPEPQEPPSVERPIFRGLTVKMKPGPPTESSEDIRATADEAAKRVGGQTPWVVRDVRAADRTFRLASPATESAQATTTAEAWQHAHALRGDPRFEYVEPTFAVNGAPGETTELEDCVVAAPVTESGGTSTPIPGATKDAEWSLNGENGANILEAWKKFPSALPGTGVWVGHPDTGYRKHPEIFGMPSSPVHPDLGWDFVDNDKDPSDAFEEGMLRWPGHGTRTSSVIVSPRGRQLPGGTAGGISGVAPGAKLIPLRVANGVVLFDQSNLASAIRAAAGDDRTLVKQKVDVISISLGGPPSRALEDAVQLAERNGVLVIAAAGNNVKKVVWPARYPHVIAMAASNFDRGVWSGSSGGSMVAIGAPGESVWIASPKMQGDTAVDCLSMSSGTSYATATTAGIAAMWVSLHKGTPQFAALVKSGQVTSAFRQILRSTRRPGKDWDTSKYGPGIVDAAAVLAAALPAPTESAAQPRSACDADLAALESLFEDVADPRARVASLFGRRRSTVCEVAHVADEAAFHYATNPDIASALEAVARRAAPTTAQLRVARAALAAAGSETLRQSLPRN